MAVLSRPAAAPPSNAQLLALLDGQDQPLLVIDARARLSLANRAAQQLLGCEAGQGAEQALAALDEAGRQRLLEAGARRDGELLHLRLAEGGRWTARWQALPGGAWALAGVADAAAGLPALSEGGGREMLQLLWPSSMPMSLQDEQFRYVAVNDALARLLGRPAAECVGRDPVEFAPPEERGHMLALREEVRQALQRDAGGASERMVFDAQGRAVWLRGVWCRIVDDQGRDLLLSVIHDATPEHAAMTRAEQSARELDQWFELSPVGMVLYDDTGLILRSNAAFEGLAGRTPVTLADAAPDLQHLLGWHQRAPHPELQPEAPPLEARGALTLADGRRLRLRSRLRALRTVHGGLRVMVLVEDRSAEDERDLAQLEMGAMMDTAGVGVATYDPERGWLRDGRQRQRAPTSPGGLAAISRDLVEPDSLPEYDRLQAALREGRRVQVRYAVRHAEMGTRWLLTRVEPGQLAGGRHTVSVVTLDVTDQTEADRRTEALLRERELMFTLADVGMAFVREGRIDRANQALAQLTGYAAAELEQLPLARLFAADPPESDAEVLAALSRSGHWSGERQMRRRDGALRWVQVNQRRVDGTPGGGLICTCVDVDERHRVRETLQLQAERTRAVLDSVLVGIVTVGERGIEWMNRSARRMFAGELADFIGEPIAIVATEERDHPLRRTDYRQVLADGQAETFECRLRGRDGREFWVVGNAVVTGRGAEQGVAGSGEASQLTFALLDIERRRQAEVSIAQAQASLQRIIETAPLAIALFEAVSARVLRMNQMAAMYLGRAIEQVQGRVPEDWLGAEDARALREDLGAALGAADGVRREQKRATRADGGGDQRVWDVRIVSLAAAAGDPQLLLVASDVTEQRAAEQARLEAAIAQREMLIKEVHHRIKNNLQGVAGLLQQTALSRPELKEPLSEAVGQVQAIAQVHGLQVGATGPLRIKPVMEAIAQAVQRTFGRHIHVAVQGEAVHRFALPEGESIPIALTVNELLTNAIKHSTGGDIHVTIECGDERLALAIVNAGRLTEGFSLERIAPGVSGLGLVRALLPRRHATLTLTQQGAEVVARVTLVPPGISILAPL